MKMYVLKKDGKYLSDFDKYTSNLDRAARWMTIQEMKENFNENGFMLDDRHQVISVGLGEIGPAKYKLKKYNPDHPWNKED